MDKIIWCAEKREGLRLIEPNPNLAGAYLMKAENALETMATTTVSEWKISTAYYTLYFSLYSLLMKTGIKCEIHSCTIEFARQFLGEYFTEEDLSLLESSLKARIDAQYYVDRTVPDGQYQRMVLAAPKFLVRCKSLLQVLDEKKVESIRKKFSERLRRGH